LVILLQDSRMSLAGVLQQREAIQIPVSDISLQFAHFVITLQILDYHIVIQLVMPPY